MRSRDRGEQAIIVRMRAIFSPLLLLAAALPISAPAQSPPGKIISINGFQMHYCEFGSGGPLLLLHGIGGCGQDWEPFIGELSRQYRVIVPDFRGHGWSTNPANRFTHRQAADDVRALLDELGVARVRAMGISSGGMTLLHFATRYPQRLDRIVLISATTHFPEQARAFMRRASPEAPLPAEVSGWFGRCAVRGETQRRALAGYFHAFSDDREDMNFTSARLATISAPTLIIHGDRDEFFPVEIPIQMYKAIPRSVLWILPGGDHVPIFGNSAPEFIRIAKKFLSAPDWPMRPSS
jgi:pimeloyl-ACP methyl ester carboxylesterase